MHTGRVLHEISAPVQVFCSPKEILSTTDLSAEVRRQSIYVAAYRAVDHDLPLTRARDRSFPTGQSVRRTCRAPGSAEKMGRW